MDALQDVGKAVLAVLKNAFAPTIYELWFQDLKLVNLSAEKAVFEINSDLKKQILETRHSENIRRALSEVIGYEARLEFHSTENVEGFKIPFFHTQPEPEKKMEEDAEEKTINPQEAIESPSIIEEYTFDNFIVGDSNRFAHAACMAVAMDARNRGSGRARDNNRIEGNPLFIYGPSGVGKTHLLFAVTNEIKKSNPNVKLIYKKGEDFTNELIQSLQNKTQHAFREKYRTVDVLLIDDVQFIAGKEQTQVEFFHTFSTLYENDKQIILTSDRPPKDIQELEDRIRTRFEWGLIADIQYPSFELRTAIINKKAEALNVSFTPDITEYLATKLQNNIRQIEGAIKKIVAISLLTRYPITIDLCRRAISDIKLGDEPVNITVDRILDAVSKKYGISTEDIKAKKRSANIVNARHICIYLIRQMTDISFDDIGEFFSRDHSTIISAFKKIDSNISSSQSFAEEIAELTEKLKN